MDSSSDDEITFHPRYFSTQQEAEEEVEQPLELPDPDFHGDEAAYPLPPFPAGVEVVQGDEEDLPLPPYPEGVEGPAFEEDLPLPLPPPAAVEGTPAVGDPVARPLPLPLGEDVPPVEGPYCGPFVEQEGRKKGSKNYVAGGKAYRKDYLKNGCLYLKCIRISSESCRGRACIVDDILNETVVHTCSATALTAEAERIKAQCLSLSETSTLGFRQIFDEACAGSEGASLLG